MKKLVEKNERILIDAKLQGRSIAGKQEEPKVETAKEYAERVMSGKIKAQ
jgi:hypothetical protein